MSTQKDVRTAWSILAIFSGVFLALSLSTTVLEVLARSSHVLDWAAWAVTFSIWLSVALYARSPEYYEALRRGVGMGRKHRKSRAEPSRMPFRRGCRGPARSRLWRADSRWLGAVAWPIVGSVPRSSDSDSSSRNDGYDSGGNRAPICNGSSLKRRQARRVSWDGSVARWFSSRASSSRSKAIRSVMPLVPTGPLSKDESVRHRAGS